MKSVKTFLQKCWQSTAVRNLGNVVISVVLSTLLAKSGLPTQDATTIGQAAGAIVGSQ